MLDPRQEFSAPEHRRYAAECRRLAAIAQPPAKAIPRQPANRDWLSTVVNQVRKSSRRERRLVTTLAHR
jgi:hypothetical protein